MSKAKRIFIVGQSGAGKGVVAEEVAVNPHAIVFIMDRLLRISEASKLLGVSIF